MSLALIICAHARNRNVRTPDAIILGNSTRKGRSSLNRGLRGARDAQMMPEQISTIVQFSAGAKNQAASARDFWPETR